MGNFYEIHIFFFKLLSFHKKLSLKRHFVHNVRPGKTQIREQGGSLKAYYVVIRQKVSFVTKT